MHIIQQTIELALAKHLPQSRRAAAKPLDDAVRYAVFPGGKRIRPTLALLGTRVFSADVQNALPAACAVEFIHASSLVFDDLPCMDDAHIRRGKCVVHKVFGEEIALLAALALLNQSYAIFGGTPALIAEATACIGVDGMIGGQALDLSTGGPAEESPLHRHERLLERRRKTSTMMRLALLAGALACGVPARQAEVLGAAGLCLGEAFQMGDDLLDARRSSRHTGKNSGQDRRLDRPSTEIDESATVAHLQTIVAGTRLRLTAEYGANNIAELMMFVDAMFARLTAQEKMPLAVAT